eukprot:sb/3479095/
MKFKSKHQLVSDQLPPIESAENSNIQRRESSNYTEYSLSARSDKQTEVVIYALVLTFILGYAPLVGIPVHVLPASPLLPHYLQLPVRDHQREHYEA